MSRLTSQHSSASTTSSSPRLAKVCCASQLCLAQVDRGLWVLKAL